MKNKKKRLIFLVMVWFCVLLMAFSFFFALYYGLSTYKLSLLYPDSKFNNFYILVFVTVVILLDITRVLPSLIFFNIMSNKRNQADNSYPSKVYNIMDFKKINSLEKVGLMTVLDLKRFITELSIYSIVRLLIDVSLAYFLIWGSFN